MHQQAKCAVAACSRETKEKCWNYVFRSSRLTSITGASRATRACDAARQNIACLSLDVLSRCHRLVRNAVENVCKVPQAPKNMAEGARGRGPPHISDVPGMWTMIHRGSDSDHTSRDHPRFRPRVCCMQRTACGPHKKCLCRYFRLELKYRCVSLTACCCVGCWYN